MKCEKPLAIDAFCGAGGLSLGLINAGFDICLAFDNDKKAVETYRNNLQEDVLMADAYDINLHYELNSRNIPRRDIFLFAGGPPCQGFSIQRRGIDSDPRNDLVTLFFNNAFSIKPKFIMMENVLGIKGKRGESLLQYVKVQCKKFGYDVHVAELNAADFGAPQIRRRYFIVAERKDADNLVFRFPKPKLKPDEYKTVYDTIKDLPLPPPDGSEHPNIPNHRCDVLSPLNRERFKHVPQSGGRDDIPTNLRLKCHNVSTEKIGHRYVYGRLDWNRPSGVITARFDSLTRGRFGHPSQTRTISLREGARLQTFPDDFVFVGNKVEVARQIGNAVPPILAKALGSSFMRCWNAFNKNRSPKQIETQHTI